MNEKLYLEVPSLAAVDYSDLRLPLAVIYQNPSDMPGETVTRIFDTAVPTNAFCRYENTDEAKADAKRAGFTSFIKATAKDDPCIVGTYIGLARTKHNGGMRCQGQ